MSLCRTLLFAAVTVAACARHPAPAPPPAPVAPVVAPAPVIPDTIRIRDSVAVARDSAAKAAAEAAAADSAAIERLAREIERSLQDSAALARDTVVLAALGAEPEVVFPMLSLDAYAAHDRVEHFVGLFTGTARDRVGERMSRGTRYGTMIRDKLRAAGIPEDMTYLALIESGYDPDAYSRAAAVGMWQFMAGTARGVGMRVDWWVDERRDPVRATDGAIKFLTGLRTQFGSFYLAAAAYNGGPGRVSRGLSRLAEELGDDEPDDKFFTLASTNLLRAETRNYVPQLIAAAIVGRDPLRYGIVIDTQPGFVYDTAMVAPATGLAPIARICGTTPTEMVALNGQILRGMTPPDKSVALRLPAGCAVVFDDAIAALPDSARSGVVRHAVKKGETMGGVAKRAGMSVTTLRRYNPKLPTASAAVLKTGAVVLIPKKETIAAARNVPDPSIERYGTAVGGSYVVRRGDTLGGIALRNNVSLATLKRINGLRSDKIIAGQRLRVR